MMLLNTIKRERQKNNRKRKEEIKRDEKNISRIKKRNTSHV